MKWQAVSASIERFIADQQLPPSFLAVCEQFYLPLAEQIEQRHLQQGKPLVVGINGAQGSGKSTLSDVLAIMLSASANLRSVILSIDDFYLSKQARAQLADDVHPLLSTRGVPGTHDVSRGIDVIAQLRAASATSTTTIPRFDKAADDCAAPQTYTGGVDVIIFEGWCVGARAQAEHQLTQSINQLEADEDPQGVWRAYVNHQLAGDYQRWFSSIDYLVMLQVPGFEKVQQWRSEQEDKLRQRRLAQGAGADISGLMDKQQIARFIQHYERITRAMLEEMPQRADYLIVLNDDHTVRSSSRKQEKQE